jgi:hypothetical protein
MTAEYACLRCRDTGWAPVADPRGVERCVCWNGNPVLTARRRDEDARLAREREWSRARARRARPTAEAVVHLGAPVVAALAPLCASTGETLAQIVDRALAELLWRWTETNAASRS